MNMRFDPRTGEFIPEDPPQKAKQNHRNQNRRNRQEARRQQVGRPPQPYRQQQPQPVQSYSTKPSRLWPETAFGKLFYLVSIGGGAVALAMIPKENMAPGMTGPLLAGAGALSVIIWLTVWRNLLINWGILRRPEIITDAKGNTTKVGGFGIWDVIWVLIGLGVGLAAAALDGN